MDKKETRVILAAKQQELRQLAYEDLRQMMDTPETSEVTVADTTYQVEVEVWRDSGPKDAPTLRVRVNVDDGGFRSLMPISDDFLIAPDGSFVDE